MSNKFINWFREKDPFELLAIVLIVIGILVLAIIFFASSFQEFLDKDRLPLNEYGDLISGVVGSVWALAGVLLFYASLASQQKDIEEQRNLLVRQIEEVVKQTNEFRKQSDIQSKQQYESTFFQLLRFHNEIVANIILEVSDIDFVTGTNQLKQIAGRKSFVEYYDIYKRFFNTQLEILMTSELSTKIIQKIVDNSYSQFFDEYQADLGHYFRNLYNILYFINTLEDKEKSEFYLDLLHAQLSNYEIALLYFHCARSGTEEYKTLVEKYELLSTIPDDNILRMSEKLYSPRAFGKDEYSSEYQDEQDEFFEANGWGKNHDNDFQVSNSDLFGNNDSRASSSAEDDILMSESDILAKFEMLSKKMASAESQEKEDVSHIEDSFNEGNENNGDNELSEKLADLMGKLGDKYDSDEVYDKEDDYSNYSSLDKLDTYSYSDVGGDAEVEDMFITTDVTAEQAVDDSSELDMLDKLKKLQELDNNLSFDIDDSEFLDFDKDYTIGDGEYDLENLQKLKNEVEINQYDSKLDEKIKSGSVEEDEQELLKKMKKVKSILQQESGKKLNNLAKLVQKRPER